MMIECKTARPYIENLRNDPRTHALMTAWVTQALMTEEAKTQIVDERSARKFAHNVAREAVALAMSFVLDNDSELQHARAEIDRVLERTINAINLKPPSVFIVEPDANRPNAAQPTV